MSKRDETNFRNGFLRGFLSAIAELDTLHAVTLQKSATTAWAAERRKRRGRPIATPKRKDR